MVHYSPSSEDVRLYEVAVLLPYPANQKEEAETLKQLAEIFSEAGAKEIFKDAWGRRGLAYSIGGFKEGQFLFYYLELDPSKIAEIETQLRILKGVLRHMIIKPPKKYEIISYAERFEQWKDSERKAAENAVVAREEKLKKQVVDKAKRASKVEKKPEVAAPAMTEATLSEQLEKLTSDKDIEI